MPKYVKPSYIKQNYQLSSQTIRRWVDLGFIKSVTNTSNQHRLIDYDSFLQYIGQTDNVIESNQSKQKICYARVSSNHQKQDLERQVQYLQETYPNHKIVKDIGSGLNWNRKGLQTVLEQLLDRNVEEIVVTHSDRLSRFGFDILQWLAKKFNCSIVVLNKSTGTNPQIKMAEDMLSIANYFTAKNNGLRASNNRKKRASKVSQDQDISNNTTKGDT